MIINPVNYQKASICLASHTDKLISVCVYFSMALHITVPSHAVFIVALLFGFHIANIRFYICQSYSFCDSHCQNSNSIKLSTDFLYHFIRIHIYDFHGNYMHCSLLLHELWEDRDTFPCFGDTWCLLSRDERQNPPSPPPTHTRTRSCSLSNTLSHTHTHTLSHSLTQSKGHTLWTWKNKDMASC
jgi:hypothetical protein